MDNHSWDSKHGISQLLLASIFIIMASSMILLSGCTSVSKINNNNNTYSQVENSTPIILKESIISNKNIKLGVYQALAPQYASFSKDKIVSENYSKGYLKQYMTNVKTTSTELLSRIDQCNQNVGVYQVSCADKETCATLCKAASDKCAADTQQYGNNMGNLVISYLKISTQLKGNIVNVLNTGTNPYIMNDEEISNYINSVVTLVNKYNVYATHPFTSKTNFRLCKITVIDIHRLLPKNLTYNRTEWVKSETLFKENASESENQLLSTYDIQISGQCNKKIGLTPTPTFTPTPSKTKECTFNWNGVSPYPSPIISVSYLSNNKKPLEINVEKHTTDIPLFTPLFFMFDSFSKIIENEATVAGISLGIYIILIIISINILFTLYHIIVGALNKKSVHEGLWKGASNIAVTWKSDTIMLFVLVIISIATWVYSTKITGNSLFNVLANILVGNRYIAAVHILAVVLGFLFAYFAIQNKFRIYVMEKTYSKKLDQRLQKISDKSNKILYVRLPKIKKSIDELSGHGVDVSESMDKLNVISEKSLFRIINKPSEDDESILKSYTEMLDIIERRMSVLSESMNEKYDGWKKKILNIIKERKSITLDEMPFVPKNLRVWISTRIPKDESDIEFKNDALFKVIITYGTLASNLMKMKDVHGILFYKDKVLASEFEAPLENTVMSSLGIMLDYHLKSVEARFGTKISLLTSLGANNVLLYASTTNINVLLLANKNSTGKIWSDIKVHLKEIKRQNKKTK